MPGKLVMVVVKLVFGYPGGAEFGLLVGVIQIAVQAIEKAEPDFRFNALELQIFGVCPTFCTTIFVSITWSCI